MTEDQMIEDQEVELHDDDNEVVEEAHDPKNAEAQSVASVDKAGGATGTAKARKGDQTKKDPMQKLPGTKAGMINAAYNHMAAMKKEDLAVALKKLMSEDVELDADEADAAPALNYEADFSDDLNALINDEATLSEEFKDKASIIFEAAIKSKLAEEIDRLEEKYNEELEAEIASTKEDLVEKVDSYLNYVVENWMEENKVAIQTGLRTEIAEDFMNKLKDLFTESYIEVPESKVDLVDDLAETVEELEEKLNETTGKAIAMAEELESYKREAIIREASRDLADTQVEKLKSLVEDVDFDDEETFAKKVATVKESYFNKATKTESADFVESDESESDDIVEASGSMAQYLAALKKTQ
jgi:hypothetical protein